VVEADRLHLYSERSTVKAGNVARDPRVVVHLESGSDVTIVRGVLIDLGRPGDTPAVVAALDAKYDQPDEVPFLPSHNPDFDVLWVLDPQTALCWALPDSSASQRRWSAGSGD
jgi:hypothetical protein